MIVEINAVVQSVRTLTDLLKTNKALANSNELNAAISEVMAKLITTQSVAMTSQEKQSALAQRITELEKEIMELKNWQREAERYQLTEIAPGITAYIMKPGMENGDGPHKLCANCFAGGQKRFLQHLADRPEQLRCAHCKSEFAPSEERPIRITRF